ncbi:MAG: DUF1385 domain-containing protein [Eubacteriales bacterium]|nr:DUF1385 domain-containing protein [Eubacteriales bacterium]
MGKKKKKKKCYCGIGGQAVLEGVMMKNSDRYAVAVRKPDGTIEVMTEDYTGIWGEKKVSKIPFIRGVFNFVDSLVLGMKTLTWSAQFYEEEDPKKEAGENEEQLRKAAGGASEKLVMGATVAFSIVMAVAIFIMLPYFLSMLFSSYIRNASLLAILEGVLRILIFLGYVAAISAMKDIRRVYMYHGAEHKCINCIERGRELTVKNVRKSSRQHRRCGTSFLLFVMVVSVILFMFIRVGNPVLRLLLRLALVPVIAGISYEIIRLAGKSENLFVRIISAPGMWLQKLTTREPDDSMIEVAIASVEAVFDWKAYLKDTFGYDIDAWERKEREEEAREAAEAAAEQQEAETVTTQEPAAEPGQEAAESEETAADEGGENA